MSELVIGLDQLKDPATCCHENVMKVLGVVPHHDGSLAFIYNYCGPIDLGQHIQLKYPEVEPFSSSSSTRPVMSRASLLRQQAIIKLILQAAAGYRHLHKVHGVVHLDGKFANTMVHPATERVSIIDLHTHPLSPETGMGFREGSLAGTPGWVAAEVGVGIAARQMYDFEACRDTPDVLVGAVLPVKLRDRLGPYINPGSESPVSPACDVHTLGLMTYQALFPSRAADDDEQLLSKLESRQRVLAAAEDRDWAQAMAGFMLCWMRPVALHTAQVVDELPLVPGVKAALKGSLPADPDQRWSLDVFIMLLELGVQEIEELLAAAAEAQQEVGAAAGAAVGEAQAAVAAAEEREAVSRAQAEAEVEQLKAKLAAATAELQLLKTSSSALQQVEGAGVSKGDGGFELGRLMVKPAAAADVECEDSGIMAPCTPSKVSDSDDNSSSSWGAMTMAVDVAVSLPAAALEAATTARQQQGEGQDEQQQQHDEEEGQKELQQQGQQEEGGKEQDEKGRRGAVKSRAAAAVRCREQQEEGRFKLPKKLWRVCKHGVCAVLRAVVEG